MTAETDEEKTYVLHGQLFFGSISSFKDLFHPREDPADVVIDFHRSRVWDHSALEAIDVLAERYLRNGTRLHMRGLSVDCKGLLYKAGNMVETDVNGDPHYRVVVDYKQHPPVENT